MRSINLGFITGKKGLVSKQPCKPLMIRYPIPEGLMIDLNFYLRARAISTVAELLALYIWGHTEGFRCVYVDLPYTALEKLHIATAECKKALKAMIAEGLLEEMARDRYSMSVYISDPYTHSKAFTDRMLECYK